MELDNYKDKLIDKLIEEFKNKFEEKIGIAPIINVTYTNYIKKEYVSLETLLTHHVDSYIP
jgi:hypothetical protein